MRQSLLLLLSLSLLLFCMYLPIVTFQLLLYFRLLYIFSNTVLKLVIHILKKYLILTLKELWTNVSSKSMTIHFLCISWWRMGGNRRTGLWGGEYWPSLPPDAFDTLEEEWFPRKQHSSDLNIPFLAFFPTDSEIKFKQSDWLIKIEHGGWIIVNNNSDCLFITTYLHLTSEFDS